MRRRPTLSIRSQGLAGEKSREGDMDTRAAQTRWHTNKSFTSDNTAGACLGVLEAIATCNAGPCSPYGADDRTHVMERQFGEIFERDVSVFLVPSGTAANALSLGALTPPWGSIFCHADSHINTDECGAVEFYTGGAKLISVAGSSGKLDPEALREAVVKRAGDIHSNQPACVSITQATESGSIYQREEIEAIAAICKSAGVRLHMDGARFANAIASTNCSPAQMTWMAGVDALSFGATKNGTIGADAIVLFDKHLSAEMGYRRKRAGHLISKMRFISAQMIAYLDNGLWLDNARRANAMALRLANGLARLPGVELTSTTEANIVFCRLPGAVADGLRKAGFNFYDGRWETGVSRFVTSFSTSSEDIDELIAQASRLTASR